MESYTGAEAGGGEGPAWRKRTQGPIVPRRRRLLAHPDRHHIALHPCRIPNDMGPSLRGEQGRHVVEELGLSPLLRGPQHGCFR